MGSHGPDSASSLRESTRRVRQPVTIRNADSVNRNDRSDRGGELCGRHPPGS